MLVVAWLCTAFRPAAAAPAGKPEPAPNPKPTMSNVAYGPDPRQVLDFWKADAKVPTPLVFYIHGGSWVGGSKNHVEGLRSVLDAGISVVSVEYRLVGRAQQAGVKPPVAWPMHDVARALQFVRSKAADWNVDETRIGVGGNSAGACSGLWLAFHDDMADPRSADPVARESTRLACAGLISAQTSLDPKQMREWIPNIDYGGHAFGFAADPEHGVSRFEKFLRARESILPWIEEYSPYALATADDPPVYLGYAMPPALGQPQVEATHSANFGVGLQQKLRRVGVPCQVVYPGAPAVEYRQAHEFLVACLRALPERRPVEKPPR